MCNQLLSVAGLLSIRGVIGEIQPWSEGEKWIRFEVKGKSGTDDHSFKVSVLKRTYDQAGIEYGSAIFSIGRLRAWQGDLVIGFSFEAETIEKDEYSPEGFSLEHRFHCATDERDEFRDEIRALKERLGEIQKLSQTAEEIAT